MKFLLVENGSYSNPECCFFSRCSRRFLNGSERDGSGDPLSAFVCCGSCSGTVGGALCRLRLSRETQTRNWAYDISIPSRLAAAQTSLSFIPAANPASISAQAQMTCPILVAG